MCRGFLLVFSRDLGHCTRGAAGASASYNTCRFGVRVPRVPKITFRLRPILTKNFEALALIAVATKQSQIVLRSFASQRKRYSMVNFKFVHRGTKLCRLACASRPLSRLIVSSVSSFTVRRSSFDFCFTVDSFRRLRISQNCGLISEMRLR